MKIWLDDIREAPEGWTRCYSVIDAMIAVDRCVTHLEDDFVDLSLDHDLGDFEAMGGDAIKFVLWMAKHNLWPANIPTFHTANAVGRANMIAVVNRYGPYDREAR